MSIKIFVSYSHQDERYLAKDSLLGFLKGLERTADVEFWWDEALVAGSNWNDRSRTMTCNAASISTCLPALSLSLRNHRLVYVAY